MLKNDRVTIINKGIGTQDKFGGYIEGAETSKIMFVNMQPFSRELLLKKYGYDIEVSKLMICNLDDALKEGSVVVYKNKNYEVKKIPWDSGHFEAVLNQV